MLNIFKTFKISYSKFEHQFLAVFTIQFLTFSHGIGLGWLSPTLHSLLKPDSPNAPFQITIEQASWIGSLFGLGSLFGNIIFGFLLNKLGRKWCLYLLALPHMFAWILIFFSESYFYLYVSRFLAGTTGGGNYIIIPIFISEIADPSIRGVLSSMAMLFLSVGIMVGFTLSTHLDYYLNPCLVIMLPLIYLLAATRLPETPQFLLRKQKTEEARKSFDYYKNKQLASLECSSKVADQKEFEDLQISIEKSNQENSLELKDFAYVSFLKPFSFALILVLLNQFSGSFAFFNYMSTIFAESGTKMEPNSCTILMGIVQIVGTCFTLLVVDRFGRKVLMLVSSGGMAAGLFIFGFYVRFTTDEIKSEFSWAPLVLMVFIILIGSIGIVALLFTIIVEVLPVKMRSIGCSICMAFLSSMVFVSLKLFPVVLHNYGLDILLFSCGSVCIAGWFYMLIFQKETKGINLNK